MGKNLQYIFQTFLYVERAVISQQAREKIIFYNLTRFSPRSVLTMDSRNFPPNNNLDVTITETMSLSHKIFS